MHVSNVKDLANWLDNIWSNGHKFLRFLEYPIGHLNMGWKEELRKQGRLYEKNERHFPFHHLRLLFKDMKKNKIKHPLVGVFHESQIQVNPGGSRLMVAKKLRIPTVPLDYICDVNNQYLIKSTKFIEVKDVEQFVAPFNDVDLDVKIDLHEDKNFWYEIIFSKQFHWCNDDIDQWIEAKRGIKCPNPLDYYFI